MKDGLTDSEAHLWWRVLLTSQGLQTRFDAALRQRYSLDHLDYRILVRLASSPDRTLRMSELAFYASVDSSLMTYRIKRLERRDLVTRGASADDGRGVNARLTDRGCELVDDIAPWYGDTVRRFLDDVDETDREVIGRVFGRLWDRLSREKRLPDESI